MNRTGFINALSILIYIAVVATIVQNGDRIFGEMTSFIGPIAFLLLFTLSAIVVGGLVLGKPLMLYIDGRKKEAVALFLTTSAWTAGFTVLALVIAYLIK